MILDFVCPVLDIPMRIPEHDTVIACLPEGWSLTWPCLPCDQVHRLPLTELVLNVLDALEYSTFDALCGEA